MYHLPDGTFQESRLFCQNRLPVKYDPKAPSPERWLTFLHELLDDADIPTLQEYLGYCLIPSTKGQKMMLIVGKGGEGKSRIGLVLKRLMGDAASNGSVQKVENNRFARADLERRLLMIDNDMDKLRPYHIEALYDTLSKTPCGQYVGGKRRDLSPKQQKRTLSGTTLHEVHQLLHNSFLLAVEWGILIKSPVPVEAPKKTTQERSIWEVEEMRAALDSMEDPILHLAVHLTLVGALREGEVAGLTPEDIDFDAANGMGTFTVNRSMQRVQKDTLAQVDKGCILRIFPDKLEGSKTSLILKDTKTEAVLPHHLNDRRPAGGTEAVAGTAEKGRSPRPGALPQQRDAAAATQRSGGGAGAHPQKVPEMAGCAPRVPPHRLSRFTPFQCALSADDLWR